MTVIGILIIDIIVWIIALIEFFITDRWGIFTIVGIIIFFIFVVNLLFYFLERVSSNWKRLRKPPKWVYNASERWYHKQQIRPYDKIKYFNGKTYTYKVFYKAIAQGNIKPEYYRKRKRK
jgi:hypothetical protein